MWKSGKCVIDKDLDMCAYHGQALLKKRKK